ncbi:MAG: tryptophan--tRNA ligase [Dehalococcoidia bacterium]|nr:tryptophan--tRNA ligase [Dehalococcoidia bacterium]
MKQRVFSGARPTGKQHLGNYLGAIQNYVKLQDEHECIYCVVDIHALTTPWNPNDLKDNIREMVLDWLAAGIDPKRSIVFTQSHVPEVTQLHTLFSMITPLGWLLRVPSFKEKARQFPENVNYGLVGYPVLMTADIALYKATVVPVGEDQVAHLELAREIVRRFNQLFGATFPEPQPRLTEYPMVVGLDGYRKMSKTLGNHIELAATPEETRRRILTAFTDPARRLRSDPGHPESCNVFHLYSFFDAVGQEAIARDCRAASIGCVGCKELLAQKVNEALAPFRERRAEIAARKGYVEDVLRDGAQRAEAIARSTMEEVMEKVGLAWNEVKPPKVSSGVTK